MEKDIAANTRRPRPPAAPKTLERRAWAQGCRYVAGVDEAGCGPLAGPVVAAAVIFPPEAHIPHLTDSKLLRPEEREALAEEIQAQALTWAIGFASPALIDRLNIRRATYYAMRQAIRRLRFMPDLVLVDGWPLPLLDCPQINLFDGDRRCFSIAAASILAKVTRDRLMKRLDALYPEYGFARHKGYPCRAHLEALRRFGPCPVHRRSFAPVADKLQQ